MVTEAVQSVAQSCKELSDNNFLVDKLAINGKFDSTCAANYPSTPSMEWRSKRVLKSDSINGSNRMVWKVQWVFVEMTILCNLFKLNVQ